MNAAPSTASRLNRGLTTTTSSILITRISVDVDAEGKVFVADLWAARIQVISPEGKYLTTIGMSWGPDDTSAGDIGTGKFRDPRGVAIDAQGNVLVADQYNQRIQKFSPGVDGWHQVNLNGSVGQETNSRPVRGLFLEPGLRRDQHGLGCPDLANRSIILRIRRRS